MVIRDRLCSSDRSAKLLKNFKHIKLNFKESSLSAADSIVYAESLGASTNLWTLELSAPSWFGEEPVQWRMPR